MPEGVCQSRLGAIADRIVRDRLLEAHFQPIVDLRTGKVAGHECLSRPSGAAAGVSPAELFSERMDDRRRHALERAASEITLGAVGAITPQHGLVFVNCSPGAMVEAGHADSIVRLIREAGLEPEQVVIEVTEEPGNGEERDLVVACDRHRALGLQIALDDIGVGGSGLGRLSRIRPDWVKIDRGLVHGLDADRDRRRLVEFLVRLARDTGANVVAEGIETNGELAAAVRIGASHGQGFGIARPAPRPAPLGADVLAVIRGAGAAYEISARLHPLTGLPDRVECERRLAAAGLDIEGPQDAAIVDLRGLSALNADLGYGAGDQAIVRLGSVLVDAGWGRVRFVGHGGDDRFVLIGEASAIRETVAVAVERLGQALGPISVRAIGFPGVIDELGDVADLFQVHAAVKSRVDGLVGTGDAVVEIPFAGRSRAA